MASSNERQQLHPPPGMEANDGNVPARKRGRPPITFTEELLERRRLSMQRVNASRPREDGVVPARRRGRPPIVVTEEVLERRRLSRQRLNASRPGKMDSVCKFDRSLCLASLLISAEPESSGLVNVIHASDNNPSTSSGQDNGATQPVEGSETISHASTVVGGNKRRISTIAQFHRSQKKGLYGKQSNSSSWKARRNMRFL